MSYANLLDAMLGHLRAAPALVAAFGDDPSTLATDKFWPTPVRKEVQLPWAAYEDGGGDVQAMTANGDGRRVTIETAAIRFVVVAQGKDAALALVRLLIATLNDPPLAFADGLLMDFRAGSPPSAVPVGDLAPGSPNAYAYGVTFSAMVQRTD